MIMTDAPVEELTTTPHRLRLIWQNPSTHGFVEVGELTDLGDNGEYVFTYLPAARSSDFVPLVEFPDTEKTYISTTLPAFFGCRVMTSRRPGYEEYLSWLGLRNVPTPMEILARTGGPRATDTFHVVDSFAAHDGRRLGRFFASGLSHIPDAEQILSALRPDEELALRDEPENPANQCAILLDAARDTPIGWVPDWLLNDVHQMRREGPTKVFVDQVNVDAPNHLKLLCRLEAEPTGQID